MNPTPENQDAAEPGTTDAPSFDPAMLAATNNGDQPNEDQPSAERSSGGEDTAAANERPAPRENDAGATPKEAGAEQGRGQQSGQSGRSTEDLKKMQTAREQARSDARARLAKEGSAPRPGQNGPGPQRPGAASANRPYVDPRVAAAEATGPPPWLGTRWREIPPEFQRDAWVGLRRWVDWLINEFRLEEAIVPGCWFQHPNLVQELYAAMCMEQKAWEEAAASLTPMMMWHPNLNAMISRLREMVADLGGCSKGTHQPIEHIEREYDEDQWRRVAYGRRDTATVARPGPGEDGYLIRARVMGPDGELAVSESVVGISPIKGAEPPAVDLRRDPTTAAKDSVIHLDATAVAAANDVIWEKATTWTQDEDTHAILSADWHPVSEPSESHGKQDPAAPAGRNTAEGGATQGDGGGSTL